MGGEVAVDFLRRWQPLSVIVWRVSGTVKDLLAGSGLAFDDRGERQLKGVPGSWRIYAVA
jgi:hypothetical protein